MFPSCGVFANIRCPLAVRGLCERPHCFYQHAAGSREEFHPRTVNSSGVGNRHRHAASGAAAIVGAQNDSFHELEWINKEIETVRQEVEEEKRRLSGCQTILAYAGKSGPTLKYVRDATDVDRGSSNLSKIPAKVTKYVVDKSKPRTDLEYDPLSNFSADVWCQNSSSAGQKVKNVPATSGTASAKKKTVAPDFDEDDDDDCVLIIDVPPPSERSDHAQNPAHLLSGKSTQGEAEQMKTVAARLTLPDTPSQPPIKSKTLTLASSSAEIHTRKNPDDGRGGENEDPVSSSIIHREDAETPSGSNSQPQQVCSTSSNTPLTHQPVVKKDVIIISSEDEEQNYSDMELSDSDPMEECYKIFMEANGEEIPDENKMRPEDEVKPAVNTTPQPFAGKKRLAHESTHAEPVAKCRPCPQILVPFCGPAASGSGSQSTFASKMQQMQQREYAAAVHRGQALVSTTQNKAAAQNCSLTPLLKPAPSSNAFLNHAPVGGTVFAMGSNLHVLVPDSASSLTPSQILTPIGQASSSTVQLSHSAASVEQRGRPGAPVLIPALARKPSLTPGGASAPAGPAPPAAAKSVAPGKRKLKQHNEATKEKVPHEVRQRFVNMFTEEFLKTVSNVDEAFQKALAEENAVYNRSVNKMKYQSVAVNALKRLRNQSTVVSDVNQVKSGRRKGNVPLNLTKFPSNDDMELYKRLKNYILTDDKLLESNYPILNPEKSGCAVLFSGNRRVNADPLKKICCRCGATYSVNPAGKHLRQEECTYHYGRGLTKRVPGGVETRYSCCEGVMGSPGCQVFKLHVHDFLSLEGFVATAPRGPSDTGCPGVFSLDCEMCYTTHGLELSRVTVVDSSLQVVFDTFVEATSEVIDYNTRFSGISEEDVKGNCASFQEVREILLGFISADTILIGHGLQTALCLLKLLHGTVVDTSEVFPHRLGPPHKLTLNKLTAEHLRKIIQESVCGHDTAEDATACMELMLWKAREDGKLKK